MATTTNEKMKKRIKIIKIIKLYQVKKMLTKLYAVLGLYSPRCGSKDELY